MVDPRYGQYIDPNMVDNSYGQYIDPYGTCRFPRPITRAVSLID